MYQNRTNAITDGCRAVQSLVVEDVSVDELTTYERNSRTHSESQVRQLAKSITEFGFTNPVLVDEANVLIAGHGRLEASRLLGLERVPAIRLVGLSDDQKKALRIADNKLAMNAGWDEELLKLELGELNLAGFDLDLVGFSDDELVDLLPDKSDDESADDVPADDDVETRVKRGEVWRLGDHRLMCGDATDDGDVSRLMCGDVATLVFTDPPYGMGKEADGVQNDNLYGDRLLDFNRKWIPLSFKYLSPVGSWYCWGIDEPLMDIYAHIIKPMMSRNEATFRNLLTWDKGCGQGQNSEGFRMYPIADEKCLFVMAGVQGFSTNADCYFEGWESIRCYLRKERDAIGWSNGDMKRMVGHSATSGCHWFDKSQWSMPTEEEYKTWQRNAKGKAFKREYDEIKREYESTRAYFDNTHDNQNNVWHFARTSNEERELTGGHATPKPIALCARAIKSSSRVGDIVLDVFGGSGSTLVACEQTARRCLMMELDEHYCDVIIARWEALTGRKAERL